MSERNREAEGETQPAPEQGESYKRHGDKLEPIIPRHADQGPDEEEAMVTEEESPLTGDRGKGAR